eukprot:TRINITY_DN10880_c0_g1_i3.p1 TRINITY_DN10880_c0_g1~~TRINITY_DN10880_c0_g1_i3.p1  ORF type:complete len:168 (-),score=24.91 TRINITY_DN10880_c0_g1_i3:35-538(-)
MSHGERMIEIIGGVGPTVDVVHMGNRMNPEQEPPKVRFVKSDSADRALQEINAGTVCVNGVFIKARYKETKGKGKGRDGPSRDLDISSRDLMGEKSKDQDRSRSRDNDRGGRSDIRSDVRRSREEPRGRGRSDSRRREQRRGRSDSRRRDTRHRHGRSDSRRRESRR